MSDDKRSPLMSVLDHSRKLLVLENNNSRSSQPQYDGDGGRAKVDLFPVPRIKSKSIKKTKPHDSAKQIKQTNTIRPVKKSLHTLVCLAPRLVHIDKFVSRNVYID